MDPEFRVPLLADGGVIAATVDKTLGKGGHEGESPTFESLVLDVRDVTRAGTAAHEVQRDLYGDPDLLQLAIQMLNEQLNNALGTLIGVDRKQIYDVMLNVREALLDEGKTLVLLVEDFALLRGVETQLLDAMIADAESQGDRVLCPMRSALAVTSGYFEGKETALTRIHSRGGFVYSLDAELDESENGVTSEYINEFVATYLNAARVGRDQLEKSFRARAAPDRAWVDNACENCPYVAECHEAFGHAEGYGLYPFNAHALDRIVNSQTDRFDPRHILQILDQTLRRQRQKLLDGEFPDPEWAAQYDQQRVPGRPELRYLPAAVATTYEELDPGTAERRKTLLTFWGGVPQRAVNLDETIHEAFDLPALPGLERDNGVNLPEAPPPEPSHRERSRPDPGPAPQVSAGPTAQELDDRALDRWGHGKVLEQGLANEVRKALATAVRGALEWSAFGVDPKALDRLVVNQAFSLGATAKGEGSAATRTIGTLEPSDANAFLLQGVLAAERGGDWSFDRGLDRLVAFSELVDAWADEALRRLQPSDAADVIPLLLLLGGAVLGLAGPDDPPGELLASLFDNNPAVLDDGEWGAFQRWLADGPSGAASRAELITMLGTDRQLRRAMDAKNAIAIDAGPLLAAIDELSRNGWEVPSSDDLARAERSVKQYADTLRHDLKQEVRRRLQTLAARRARASALLGDDRDPTSIIASIRRAVSAASNSGVAPRLSEVDRTELERRFSASDLTMLERLAALDRIDELTWAEQLALVVATEREDFGAIDQYTDWADGTLSASMEQAEARLAGAGESDETIGSITAALLAALGGLADELEGAPR